MSADIGLKTTTDFFILPHILEKEPDLIEYGGGNNININHQQQALVSRTFM